MYLSLDIKGIKVTRGIKMDKMNIEIQKYTWKYLIVLFFQIPLLWRAIYLRDKITQQKKKKKERNYLRVCSFWNSISVDFSSDRNARRDRN